MSLVLDCYITLQIAQTLILPLPVMAETLVLSTNFCCRCREPGLIEIFENLIRRAVSCFERTERTNIQISHRENVKLGVGFRLKATGTPKRIPKTFDRGKSSTVAPF